MELVLASQSPRRRELLERMGVGRFEVCSPDIDETMIPGEDPASLVERLSREKAAAVLGQAGEQALVIAADTVVVLDGAILGKPAGQAEAVKMLTALSDRTHEVYTGLTVQRSGERVTEHERTLVRFRTLSPEEISAYVGTGEPMDKAGAYGIQGFGALLVEAITGDYYNVMGLPVCHLGRVLARFGVSCLGPA